MKTAVRLIAISIAFFSAQGHADLLFHQRSNLIGTRAALMGGAYTALAEGLSSAVYNPAGVAFVKSSAVSMSAAVYAYEHYKRTNTTTPNPIANELRSIVNVPTALGIQYRINKRWGGSFGIFQVTNLNFNNLGFTADRLASISISEIERGWLVGPSFGYKVSDHLALGISAFFYYDQNTFSAVYNSSTLNSTRQNQLYSFGFSPSFGIRYEPAKSWLVGMTVTMETVPIDGNNNVVYQPAVFAPPFIGPTTRKSVSGDVRLPYRVAVGVAHHPENGLTLSVDVIYYAPLNYPAPNEPIRTAESNNHHKERSHIDLSLGAEYAINNYYLVEGGLFTNTTGATAQYRSEKFNMYGASLGLTYRSGRITTSGGIIFQYGSSGDQTSTISPGIGYGDSAQWQALTVGLMLGGSLAF